MAFGMIGKSDGNLDQRHGIRKRDVAAYMLLPRVLPRIGELLFTGFYFFAFFMAQVYRGVRLLPADHPSLNPANIGKFGVRDVIAEAARHLVWKKENIDQVIVFLAILAGLVLLILQAVTFMMAIAMPQAVAGTPGFGFSSIFGVPAGGSSQDIAFILLDRVFGVPEVFNSCVSTSTPCYGVNPTTLTFDTTNTVHKPDTFPWPYHYGLHALFQFYSMGLLLVGVFILLYLVVVVVAETAQTGTPFGKRFNTVWAPIRLVMAFGLLIPITNGLNSAQYITLYAAKWGSNFASNGWITFNKAIYQNVDDSLENMHQNLNMVVKPKEPDAAALIQFMTLAHMCKVYSETLMGNPEYDQDPKNKCDADVKGMKIEAYLVKPGFDTSKSQKFLRDTSYTDAQAFFSNGDMTIRFGDRGCKTDQAMAANIAPVCGELTLPVNGVTDPGAKKVQEGYYEMIKYMWGGYGSGSSVLSYENTNTTGDTRKALKACKDYRGYLNTSGDARMREYALSYFQNGVGGSGQGQCRVTPTENTDYDLSLPLPPPGWIKAAVDSYMYGDEVDADETGLSTTTSSSSEYPVAQQHIIRNIIKRGVLAATDALDQGEYNVSDENLKRGWAVAGIWYNKIAEMNGALIGAAWDIPTATRYPDIMMKVLEEKKQNNVQTSPSEMFCPNLANASMTLPEGDSGKDMAQAMCKVYKTANESNTQKSTGNAMADFVNYIFGTQGLFDLRYGDNRDAHPLAQLVGVGKGLIEASIRNLAIGMGAGLLQVAAGLTGGQSGPELLGAISSFFFSIATMTLTAGFILFYVIPFLPFLYFFFAVGNWLKGVFEAMVGVPLWALAHLRIDGNGLPGEAAMNGYFMLFEIFLRPILIVFGFLASITIFAAMATVLHEIFKIAVDNLTGSQTSSGAGSAIDKFFYTVMYAVIMYIMALSSFKLIDLIPNQIMRWMGSSVSTFSDMQGSAAESLTNYTAIAGSQIVGGMTGGLKQGFGAGSQATSALSQFAQNSAKAGAKGP
ncbi:MAG: hypothetical protein DI586_05925 [Micavibrio aeruginosavorus]|uniref:Type IV secretion protein DotA n=1 Tax=Micavibrio aeruginosavorus TaxID=349221 RepID=A0A2W5HC87_9BACT|nr:MAG: hypothetical protein DI586_05925 [Micavibrio aeruginosavorus]